MSFFHPTEPIIRRKQEDLDVQDLKGLLQVNWKLGQKTLISNTYTRIDQVFLIWGWMTLIIFAIAQFMPISWTTQAYWWSALTLFGTLGMVALTRCWVRIERVSWLLYGWAILMAAGLGLTNFGIFWGRPEILLNLCPLWLTVCGLGYFLTAFALRSRTFLLSGSIHISGIFLLSYFPTWQFLTTGLIMAGTMLFLAETQWDMRPPIDSPFLTVQELAFNRQQQKKRNRNFR
ncbi:MAG: hypothetical protein ACP5D7_13400 [Limnospira sp.]